MKVKAKNKILVKCKRKDCKRIIDLRENQEFYRGLVNKSALKKMSGYCTLTCEAKDEWYENNQVKKTEEDQIKSKAKLTDGALAVYSSLMALIKIERMKPGLLKRINKEIKKHTK